MQNFIAQSMRRMGLAPKNKREASTVTPSKAASGTVPNVPLSHMEVGSKWSYSTLQYPEDIQSRTDLGHYMMFYVNVPNITEYGRSGGVRAKKQKKGGGAGAQFGTSSEDSLGNLSLQQRQVMGDAEISKEAKDGSYNTEGKSWQPGRPEKVIDRQSHQGTAAETIGRKRTQRSTDAIILYMPAQLTTNYAAGYKDNELGGNLGQIAGAVSKFINRADAVGGVEAAKEAVPAIGGIVAGAMERGMAGMASGVIGGDIMAGVDKLANRAENKFLESTFTEIPFRKFSYTWKFTPKNPKESMVAHDIIKTFKFHMLPELPEVGDFGRYFITPAEFDIFYMFRGDENEWVNKISTCVLTNMDINYSPGSYQTFRPLQNKKGAPPIEIDLKLDFMETQLITKAEVLKGF